MDKSLNLVKAIELGKTHEATLLHMKELAQVQRELRYTKFEEKKPVIIVEGSIQSLREINAQRFGTTCHRCKKRNHWEKMCRSKLANGPTKDQFGSENRLKYSRRKNNERRDVHDIRKEDTDDDDLFEEMTINTTKISARVAILIQSQVMKLTPTFK